MFTMYATDHETESVAEMALSATTPSDAREQTREWLDTFEHGFDVAVWADDADITRADLASATTLRAWILKRALERGNMLARTVGHVSELGEGERFTAPLSETRAGDWILSVHGWHRIVWSAGETRPGVNAVRYESGGSESGYPYGQTIFRPTDTTREA